MINEATQIFLVVLEGIVGFTVFGFVIISWITEKPERWYKQPKRLDALQNSE